MEITIRVQFTFVAGSNFLCIYATKYKNNNHFFIIIENLATPPFKNKKTAFQKRGSSIYSLGNEAISQKKQNFQSSSCKFFSFHNLFLCHH